MNKNQFRGGFIAAMKQISVQQIDTIRRNVFQVRAYHTHDFLNGYISALDHFDGDTTRGTARACDLGLVVEYIGYHGQGDFDHPHP